MTAATCDGSRHCEAETHLHGCFADRGKCDEPNEHRSAAKRRRVHLFDAEQTCSFCGQPWSKHDPTLPDDPDGPMLLCPVDEQLAAWGQR